MKILFTLLAALFALTVQAQTTFEHFTAEDNWPVLGEFGNIIEPGKFFCTGGGEPDPAAPFTCIGGNGIHIRGTQMVSCSTASEPYDPRVEGFVWFDFAANWDLAHTGPVSGNWRIVPYPECDWSVLFNPNVEFDTYWEGTYTGKREFVFGPELPKWITSLKLVGFGTGDLAGQKIKATEEITTYSPVPVPWELLGLGTDPEGLVDITIRTKY